jgi:hypothetical protein
MMKQREHEKKRNEISAELAEFKLMKQREHKAKEHELLQQIKNRSVNEDSRDGSATHKAMNQSADTTAGATLLVTIFLFGFSFLYMNHKTHELESKQRQEQEVIQRNENAIEARRKGQLRYERQRKQEMDDSRTWVEQSRFSWEPDRIDKEKKGKPRYIQPTSMFSEVRIPYEITTPDPEWMVKKHLGKPLTTSERELSIEFNYAKEMAWLKVPLNMKAPAPGRLQDCFMENQKKLVQCQIHCGDTGWQESTFDGIFGGCGPQDPFEKWNIFFKMKDYDETIDKFMDQFEIEPFQMP